VTIEAISHEVAASPLLVGYSVALPLAIFLIVRYWLYVRLGGERQVSRTFLAGEIGSVLVIPLASVVMPPAWVLALLAVLAAMLVVVKSVRPRSIRASAAGDVSSVSVPRHDARHEVDQLHEGREGGTAGSSEGETERARA
jgi:hypothetical protein